MQVGGQAAMMGKRSMKTTSQGHNNVSETAEEQQERPRVLIADDSKVIRTSAARILSEDFEVLLAVDGQDAYDQLSQDRDIAAVFTDIGMPYLDGLQLLAKIREHPDEIINQVPVIVVTADETDEAREDALSRGATDFITKPFNRVDLLARARSHASAQKEKRELQAFTTIDRLTKLGNEQHFNQSLRDARSFSQRHGQPLAVLRMQIDGIKPLVQAIGKENFLRRLRDIGSLLRAVIRHEDTAARIEAVHFGIVTPVCDQEGARKLAARIHKALEVGARRANWAEPMTMSIAISCPSLFPDADFEDVLADLREGVKAAASAGAGTVRLTPRTEEHAGARSTGVQLDPTAALRLLRDGRESEVVGQLDELLQRLEPLLQLAARENPEKLRRLLD